MTVETHLAWNVLLLPASGEAALAIHRALYPTKEVILFGAAFSGPVSDEPPFEKHFELPSSSNPACLPALQRLLASAKIDAVFPTSDEALVFLARHKDVLPTKILTSPPDSMTLCSSKEVTYAHLSPSLATPRLWKLGRDDIRFPVFVKSGRIKSRTQARKIETYEHLVEAVESDRDILIMEFLPGPAFTVDCFSDADSRLLFVQARARQEPRRTATDTSHSSLVKDASLPEVATLGAAISARLGLQGCWFFEMRKDHNGSLKIVKVAPRLAGGSDLNLMHGVNLPLLHLYAAAGLPLGLDAVKDITA